jgi:hypothetical protein
MSLILLDFTAKESDVALPEMTLMSRTMIPIDTPRGP